MTALDAIGWPSEALGEAIYAAARAAGIAPGAVEPPRPDLSTQRDPARLARWLESASAWLGVEVEEVSTRHADLPRALAALAPALVRLPSGAWLVLTHAARRGRLTAVGPDGCQHPVDAVALRSALGGEEEAKVAPFVEAVIHAAGVPARRRAAAIEGLRAHRIAHVPYAGVWTLRPAQATPFFARARAAGLAGLGGRVLAAHAGLYGIELAAWVLLGRGVLAGGLEPAWLVGWALLLLTAVPLRLVQSGSETRLALELGRLVKQQLLRGALALDAEALRRDGAGDLLARVLESESIEGLALSGGVSGALGVVELVFVAVVLARGGGGLLHVGLFLGWTVLAALAIARVFRRRRAWTEARLRTTRELVERMLGHKTRLGQGSPARWHDGEDGLLDAYHQASRAMDGATVVLDGLIARGWLFVGLLGLVPAVLREGTTPEAIATGIGGVLLADRALRRLCAGLTSLADAALAWRVVRPLVAAPARVDAAGVPGVVAGPASASARPVLEARDLVYRHDGRSDAVLRGCSLTVHSGARLLLRGPSGGGKSTLAAVLTGLREPSAGRLVLRGLDRRTFGAAAWRRAVACAPQYHENHVFTGSLAYNLLLADRWPASPRDLAEARAVCEELGLGELLERMPSGLQQVVGDGGWQLSHGERGRVFLARALLQGGELVVLDESFAALDSRSLEQALGCALRRAPSLLVIAHP